MIWDGGCQCGKIRFQLLRDPLVVYTCHCHACQGQSSSGFGISVWINIEDFRLVSGVLSSWATQADSGVMKECSFCADCGSRIHHSGIGGTGILSVKGGSLDEMGRLRPIAHIWMQSAQPWMKALLEGEMLFDTQPDNFSELIHAYRAQSGNQSEH